MGHGRTELIDEIKRVAEQIGSESVPRHEFLRRSSASEHRVTQVFGSYNGLVEAAGLTPLTFGQTYTDEYVLEEVVRILRLPEAQLTRTFFDSQSHIARSVCQRHFGGWINTLEKALNLLDSENDKNLIDRIEEYIRPPSSQDNSNAEELSLQSSSASELHSGHSLISQAAGNLYGDFINFRGLQHCPVNEQGVVFLFGMVCRELGYVVEIVKTGFPDCEAKRRVRGRDGMWQRVRIEFEYQARNFRTHGHDHDQCDVIVCWENNWPNCPIEVLELKSAIEQLPNQI